MFLGWALLTEYCTFCVLINDSDKHRLKSLGPWHVYGHEFSRMEAIPFLNQKTAGDSETTSVVEVTGFVSGLLTDFDDLARSV